MASPALSTTRSAALSIVIPALNESATLARCLARLQAMRARGVEVVVVDGGSSDDTLSYARGVADHALTATRGRATQMNAGARVATGERILFLHADCVVPEDADALVITATSAGSLAWGRFDVTIAGAHPLLKVVAGLMNLRSRLTGIATGDQGIFMTRAAFESVGGFPVQPLMEDIEIASRLKRLSRPISIPRHIITSGRRWEKNGVWKTIFFMWRLRLMYFFGASPQHLNDLYHGR